MAWNYKKTKQLFEIERVKPEVEITNPTELTYFKNKAEFTARAKDNNLRRLLIIQLIILLSMVGLMIGLQQKAPTASKLMEPI